VWYVGCALTAAGLGLVVLALVLRAGYYRRRG